VQSPLPQIVDHNRGHLTTNWRFALDDPFWRIYVHDALGVELLIDGQRFALRPGALHLIPAGVRGQARTSRAVVQDWLHFTPGEPWLRGIQATPPLGSALNRPWAIPDPGLVEALRGLADLPRGSVRAQTRAQAVTLGALDRLADLLPAEAQATLAQGPLDDSLTKVLRFIESNLAMPHTVPELAEIADLSPSRFTTACQERTGHSPMAWVRERRIQAAAYRLRHGQDRIEQIAAVTGFTNRNHFTRVFTAVMGIAPGAYRQKYRAASADRPDEHPLPSVPNV
jgi:AraC-like DNA-binding protein